MTRDEQILEKLSRLDAHCQSLLEQYRGLDDRFDEQKEALDEAKAELAKRLDVVNVLLTGNGDPAKGIVVRTTLLEGAVGRLEETADEDKGRRTWAFRAIVGAALTAAFSVVVTLVKLFVK